MNLQTPLRNKKGFTIIEVLISLILISILLSFILFTYREYTLQMQETAAKYEAIMLLQTKSEEIQIHKKDITAFTSGETTQNNVYLKWTIEKKPFKNNMIQAVVTVFYAFNKNQSPEQVQSFVILPS